MKYTLIFIISFVLVASGCVLQKSTPKSESNSDDSNKLSQVVETSEPQDVVVYVGNGWSDVGQRTFPVLEAWGGIELKKLNNKVLYVEKGDMDDVFVIAGGDKECVIGDAVAGIFAQTILQETDDTYILDIQQIYDAALDCAPNSVDAVGSDSYMPTPLRRPQDNTNIKNDVTPPNDDGEVAEQFSPTVSPQEAVFKISNGWMGGFGEAVLDWSSDVIKMANGLPVYINSSEVQNIVNEKMPDCTEGNPDIIVSASIELLEKSEKNNSIEDAPEKRFMEVVVKDLHSVDVQVMACEE
ncbi:MAG: hypothetical protein COX81_00110 [Candidatus Magasanikbacteria bacterium CG_4_10_14_0_2_um_filter_37_12]|uniref:Uncharacterized protein n=1 Tax=Candidatus Magasanikbacteria bacterium CG_4_10_14_0_2_um_filter_37_12 TaxID=1974637 RepID=A0A2M7VAI2_9BACT|nr:MAG: hypothetical protein COX81_00110 [Candidatus Magasanikbacteria bacterium CG_4_10_14_0_2_um_filter_37_12]